MKVAIIVAAARNGVIGRDNQLPWRLPGDLKYFKSVTLGKPVIMGRKTHESIGRPLPGRLNIVVSRREPGPRTEQLVWVKSLEEALEVARAEQPDAAEVMVMGGAQIYRECLPFADRVYLTRIDAEVQGDAWFPDLPTAEWRLMDERRGDESAEIGHSFQLFERVGKSLGAKG